ncbi:MAG: DNA cytosine methyltransferase, partial [Clostridia bacterium]
LWDTKLAVDILCEDTMDTVRRIETIVTPQLPSQKKAELEYIIDKVQLYRVNAPILLNASDYGVPQNRQRVVFIGCRNDQKLITKIPATVA